MGFGRDEDDCEERTQVRGRSRLCVASRANRYSLPSLGRERGGRGEAEVIGTRSDQDETACSNEGNGRVARAFLGCRRISGCLKQVSCLRRMRWESRTSDCPRPFFAPGKKQRPLLQLASRCFGTRSENLDCIVIAEQRPIGARDSSVHSLKARSPQQSFAPSPERFKVPARPIECIHTD